MNDKSINELSREELQQCNDDATAEFNNGIKLLVGSGFNAGQISDGYHTFDQLYEHRIELYLKLAEKLYWTSNRFANRVWCSKLHSDSSSIDGWFILGIDYEAGKQITYHLPEKYWDMVLKFARFMPVAPEFDGHTAKDVLERLRRL